VRKCGSNYFGPSLVAKGSHDLRPHSMEKPETPREARGRSPELGPPLLILRLGFAKKIHALTQDIGPGPSLPLVTSSDRPPPPLVVGRMDVKLRAGLIGSTPKPIS